MNTNFRINISCSLGIERTAKQGIRCFCITHLQHKCTTVDSMETFKIAKMITGGNDFFI